MHRVYLLLVGLWAALASACVDDPFPDTDPWPDTLTEIDTYLGLDTDTTGDDSEGEDTEGTTTDPSNPGDRTIGE